MPAVAGAGARPHSAVLPEVCGSVHRVVCCMLTRGRGMEPVGQPRTLTCCAERCRAVWQAMLGAFCVALSTAPPPAPPAWTRKHAQLEMGRGKAGARRQQGCGSER